VTNAAESSLEKAEAYDSDGVDRSQIREFLSLTPSERLERVEETARGVLWLRELNGVATTR
jgi:hypothetical protein